MKTNKKILLIEIVEELDNSNIKYVFLRHQDTVLSALSDESEDDIDIYLESKRVDDFFNILRSKNFINISPKELFVNIETGLKLDIHFNPYIRLPFPDDHFFFENISRVWNWNFLNNKALYLVLLLHPLDFAGLRGQREYSQDKIKFLKDNNNLIIDHSIKHYIESWLGNRFYQKLLGFVEEDIELIYKNYFGLKFSALSSGILHRLLLNRLIRSLRLYRRKKGFIICLMGVDGSGKTTLANNIEKFYNSYFNRKSLIVFYMGLLGPYFLPIEALSRIYRSVSSRKPKKKDDSSNQESHDFHNQGTKHFFISGLIALDYFLRNIFVVWNVFILKRVVILDRSIFDQHTRFNSNKFIGIVRRLTLKPDTFIFLKGDVSEIFKRKREYSIEELGKHQTAHLNYLEEEFGENLSVINATDSFKNVLHNALMVFPIKKDESN
jgi:hypothetical protein